MSGQLLSLAMQTAWAIEQTALDTILDVLSREYSDLEAVAAKRAARLDNADRAGVRDGVAVVPIIGPIVRRASLFADVSGLTSVESIARDFNAALSDPYVTGIMLDIDSPGGEVTGINELAEMFAAAKGKPVVAYVGGMAASAGYWLATGASGIVIDASARLGSIGVIMAVPNPAATRARDLEFVSSQSPHKRPNPTTETGKQKLQAHVDALAEVFIDAVARNRGVTAEQVRNDFGRGGMFVGQSAVSAGLADRLGSFESTLQDIAAGKWKPKESRKAGGAASLSAAIAQGESDMIKIEDLKARIMGIFDEKPETKPAAVEPAKPTATEPSAELLAEQQARQKAEAEAKTLRERVATETAERVKAQAEGFAGEMVSAGKLLPASKDALIEEWLQAAGDDMALPVAAGQPTRVDRIKARVTATTPHEMFVEKVADKGAVALGEKGAKDETPTAERIDKLMGMTSLGQSAALHAVK